MHIKILFTVKVKGVEVFRKKVFLFFTVSSLPVPSLNTLYFRKTIVKLSLQILLQMS